jgi:hypothetical protein
MATAPKSGYPTKNKAKSAEDATNRREYWAEQISKANKRWDTFQTDGDAVMDRFMLESSNRGTDKYNILYSSTETIKPSLYGQTPKVEAKNRQTDTEDNLKVAAAMLLEAVGQYAVDSLDFDYVLQNAVSDYVLPGMGNVWVRYDPKFAPMYDNDNVTPLQHEDGSPKEYLTFEGMALDYVHFKDWKCGTARYWLEVPWVSRRVYFTRKQAEKRFGKEKANKLGYTYNAQDRKDKGKQDSPKQQCVIEEIWDKENKEVVWFSEDYPDDVLDVKSDPLKLENFFPCPRPLRAVWTTQSFIPKALYSQYRAQAAELDRLTERIRYLTEALKVRGLYDGSQENLANVLDGAGNKMIPVQDWAALMGAGGITGVVQWVPIKDVVMCLSELFKQREICKNEIYEITGFSDIVRGVSKASETLGAQQIKNDWATGRLKDMQREVQGFIRDFIRLFVEIAAEHFNDRTMLLYSGLTIPKPTPEELQAQQQYQQQMQQYPVAAQQAQMQGQQPPPPPQQPPPPQSEQVQQMFQAVLKLVRSDKLRCASIGIETDSTILPDEEKERKDRMQFLSSMGAFLQQAAPLAMQFPDMRGLLGGIMMFTVRTFSASRPLEKEFETFQKKLEAAPPTPPPGKEGGDDGAAQAEAQKAVAGIKAQSDQATAKIAADAKAQETQQRQAAADREFQLNHEYRMAQIALEREKLGLEKKKVALDIIGEEHDKELQQKDKEADQYMQEVARAHEVQEADKDRAIATEEADIDREREDQQLELDRQQQSEQTTLSDALEHRKVDVQESAAEVAAKAKPKPEAKE